jgi:uncharacterized protein YbaP (TraB family)
MHQSIPLLLRVATILSLGVFHAAAAEPAPPDKPLLWKIEGGGLEKPSHLFGTVHLTTPRIEKLHPAAQRAFDTADTVATELSLDPMVQMAGMALVMRKDGKTLSESIGDDLAEKLDATLKGINTELDAAVFEPMKTWTVAMAVVLLPHQFEGRKALDQLIWQRATDAAKETLGLEQMKDQVAAMEVLDESEQVVYLRATLDKFAENERLLRRMIADYEKGDAEAINRTMVESMRDLGDGEKEKAIGEKLVNSLLVERDRTMADTIDKILRADPAKSRFIAVGAGHLVGETSIRAHLEKKGWKITRVAD